MKKEPSLLLLLMFCFVSVHCYSQVKLGIQVGVNSSRISAEAINHNADRDISKPRLGYSFGIIAENKLSDAFSLQSGLAWTNKGYKFGDKGESVNGSYEFRNNISLNYLEVPMHIAYSKRNFQVHAGPYVGIGILGSVRHKSSGNNNSSSFKGKIKFRNTVNEADYLEYLEANDGEFVDFRSRFDYGLNFGLGYRAAAALISSTYSWGMANIIPASGDETVTSINPYKGHNRVLSLSVAYFFKG
ncbi:porin family protein [Botryobacter ruber]|uniref:porin family protein n=1 Tax=Botryobacter ruber TaxID=2171629 RepID=UPI000E0A32DF|nr:porin family protein [Botryobacter ruber]